MIDGEGKNWRPAKELVRQAALQSAATLHEAMGRRGALPSSIRPIGPGIKVCGPALPVRSAPHDNLMLHQAIYVAHPGDVLVVEVQGAYEAGYWGEIMTEAALHRKLAGLVIDGCVRDAATIRELLFPVFTRGLCVLGTNKQGGGSINEPVTIGSVSVCPGDLVVGDEDGVVIVPRQEIADVLQAAQDRERKEQHVKSELKAGKTTLEIYGWGEP